MSEHIAVPKNLKVIAGKSDLDGDEYDANNVHCASQVVQASMIIKHPEYTGAATGNDIALIKTRDSFWITSVSIVKYGTALKFFNPKKIVLKCITVHDLKLSHSNLSHFFPFFILL